MEPHSAKDASVELTVITRAYDLVREMTARVAKFPRDHRFVLGDRLLTNAYEVLDLLIEAKYTKEKTILLKRVNLRLEQMRFQVRLSHDQRLFSMTQYEYVAKQINEVGRMAGGWRQAASDRGRGTNV
jgi:hypothetical protein